MSEAGTQARRNGIARSVAASLSPSSDLQDQSLACIVVGLRLTTTTVLHPENKQGHERHAVSAVSAALRCVVSIASLCCCVSDWKRLKYDLFLTTLTKP